MWSSITKAPVQLVSSPRSWSNSITASRQNCSLRGIANTTTNHFTTGDSRALLTLFALRSELPSDLPVGAFLEVEGKRYGSGSIRRLYESSEQPIPSYGRPELYSLHSPVGEKPMRLKKFGGSKLRDRRSATRQSGSE